MTPDWQVVFDGSMTPQPPFPWGLISQPSTPRLSGFQAIKPALDISTLLRSSAMSPSSNAEN